MTLTPIPLLDTRVAIKDTFDIPRGHLEKNHEQKIYNQKHEEEDSLGYNME